MRIADRWSSVDWAVIVAICFSVIGFSPNAWASKSVFERFGDGGTGAGEFRYPAGVAVNQATGDVYVADASQPDLSDGQRVSQFTADGAFVRTWGWGVATGAPALEVCTADCLPGLRGSGPGQFAMELGTGLALPQIAVDQADGAVYVADNLNDRVQKFSGSGEFVDTFGETGGGDGQFSLPQGVAVDPVSRDVYVADFNNNRVQRFSSDGTYLSQFGGPGNGDGQFAGPYRVAVDSSGRVYAVDRDNGRVQRFSDSGAFDVNFGSGLVSSPIDVAVDPATDHVFVAGSSADFTTQGIFELASDGSQVDLHAPNTGFTNFSTSMAVRSSTGRIYAASSFNPVGVVVLDDVTAPTVSIDLPTAITGTGATFNGTVNPQGAPIASYRFEYSLDGLSWTPVPADGVPVGSGTSDEAVSQVATGLEPNTEYHVRLVATKPFNAANVISRELTFETEPAPPVLRALEAGPRTGMAAWLGAQVDPRNSSTRYYVEYTLAADVAYANSSRVPTAPETGDAGAGGAFVTVSQLATDLAPETEYRFRVVASNDGGTTTGPEGTFKTDGALPKAPPGRAYEMVSPLDKNGGDVDRNFPQANASTSGAAAAGNAVAYAAGAQFADIPAGVAQGQYRSERTDSGWTTRAVSPPNVPDPDALSTRVLAFSDDLSSAIVRSGEPLTDAAGELQGSWGLYRRNFATPAFGYDLVSAPLLPLPPDTTARAVRFSYAAATKDFSHVVFDSLGRKLTSDGVEGEASRGVYVWSNGQVDFVSMLPSGAPATFGVVGANQEGGGNSPGDHAISENGQRIYFGVPASDGGQVTPLYVREGGDTTKAVSAFELPPDQDGIEPLVAQPVKFEAAKADDGSLALFSSEIRFTENATACGTGCPDGVARDLYLWDAHAPVDHRLTDLTTADPKGGGVLGITSAADDMSRVYFVATGDLADGAVPGRPNLYLWSRDHGVRHIAALAAFDGFEGSPDGAVWSTKRSSPTAQYRDARLSDDGKTLLYTSHAQVTGRDTAGRKQIYLYDAEKDRSVCLSCPPDGSAPDGDAWLFYPPVLPPGANDRLPQAPLRLPRNLSSDGKRVFFETTMGLVDADTNGKADVYMWSEGELSLISTGESGEVSEFIDASASGDDVFFTTRERLVGWDTDNQTDVYDARVGGGLPEPVVKTQCLGDQCQGQFGGRPELSSPNSDASSGEPPIVRSKLNAKRLTTAQRRALAGGRKVTLVVHVNRPGRVTVRGKARYAGKVQTVFSTSKRARRAGTVRLPVRLSKPARKALSKAGRLRVSFSIRFGGERQVVSTGLAVRSKAGRGR